MYISYPRLHLHSRHGIHLQPCKPIPQIPKSIAPPSPLINILPVLPPKLPQHLNKMQPTPRMQSRHGPITPGLIPRPTRSGPRRPGHEGGDVLRVVGHGGVGGRHGEDAFGLALADGAGYVCCYVFAEGEDVAVGDGGVGAEEF